MLEKEALVRFGVSMPQALVTQYDSMIAADGYTNRSEALRDLVRKSLLDQHFLTQSEHAAGTIVMVYDHHKSELQRTLTDLQHRYHHDIISAMHIHLNHSECLEVIVVRGKASRLSELANLLKTQKGVHYAELSVTHIERGVEKLHGH